MLLCKKYHVTKIVQGDLTLEFAPMLVLDPPDVAASTPSVAASQPEARVKGEEKRGADGLTAEQQEELFMRRMDAEPAKLE